MCIISVTLGLVPGPSRFEVEIAIAKLKKHKSPGSVEIPEKLNQAGGKMLLSAIHKLINSIWNKEELPDLWKEYIILSVLKKGDKKGWDITAILRSDVTDQLQVLIRFSAFFRYWRKNGSRMKQYISYS
jgi:hypothetical protein